MQALNYRSVIQMDSPSAFRRRRWSSLAEGIMSAHGGSQAKCCSAASRSRIWGCFSMKTETSSTPFTIASARLVGRLGPFSRATQICSAPIQCNCSSGCSKHPAAMCVVWVRGLGEALRLLGNKSRARSIQRAGSLGRWRALLRGVQEVQS